MSENETEIGNMARIVDNSFQRVRISIDSMVRSKLGEELTDRVLDQIEKERSHVRSVFTRMHGER